MNLPEASAIDLHSKNGIIQCKMRGSVAWIFKHVHWAFPIAFLAFWVNELVVAKSVVIQQAYLVLVRVRGELVVSLVDRGH